MPLSRVIKFSFIVDDIMLATKKGHYQAAMATLLKYLFWEARIWLSLKKTVRQPMNAVEYCGLKVTAEEKKTLNLKQ